MATNQTEPRALTVSQLTLLIKETLSESFAGVWVTGELSDISRPHSGHVYFTLKDDDAQIRGVMWRTTASRLQFDLTDGLAVICCGEVDVYPPRGSYQLIVRQIEPRGLGALQLALRQLQQKLAAEGLFDPRHKKPLPRFPRRIAIVTSPTSAAVRDFLEVLRRRWHGIEVFIVPSRVQGEGAANEIVRGIQLANRVQPAPDVLVVARGGGSLEDLWCFNEEKVVRAIFASRIPVVSAVGHEIDVTLSDLVADVRALTPTEAAERVVPSVDDVVSGLAIIRRRLAGSLRTRMAHGRTRLESLIQRRVFRRPLERIHELMERLDDLEPRAARAIRGVHQRARDRVAQWSAQLESLSPLGVLSRGYSLTLREDDRTILRDTASLRPGDRIISRLASGEAVSRVEEVRKEE